MDFVAVAQKLVNERFPDARAAVLAGSAADGRANELSDLDIVIVLTGTQAPFRETTKASGRLVELFVHTDESLTYWFDRDRQQGLPTLAHMLATGVGLGGPDVATMQERARAFLATGPIPLTDEQLQYRRYLLTDALDDLRGARDDDERDVVAGQVMVMAAELRLASAGCWLGKGKWLLRMLQDCDGPLASSVVAAHRAAICSGDPTQLIAVCDQVLEPVGGRLSEGFMVRSDDS